MNNKFLLSKNTSINLYGYISEPIKNVIEIFERDKSNVFLDSNIETNKIKIELSNTLSTQIKPENYIIKFNSDIEIFAYDDLGVVYALLYLSENYMQVKPFWFWTDQSFEKKEFVEISIGSEYISPVYKVRYRGWFINDEVLLSEWKKGYENEQIWKIVFETLLRCGGNIVIPGTDLNSKINRNLASSMGLFITHHHAEPLGAEMFSRKYPDKEVSIDKNEELFIKLWENAIEQQKDIKVIWNLGFRGQGDKAFWENDTKYNTPKERGLIISKVIYKQYKLVKNKVKNPIFCTNLYGEIMELYKEGYIKIPEDVIKIWADNGYGKMVSRRQNNHNPRIHSLPDLHNEGLHGIYYHASFHDLQASNHITMSPASPYCINEELSKAFNLNANDLLILNCGNIRPHIYILDIIRNIWKYGKIDIDKHGIDFVKTYFHSDYENIFECIKLYSNVTIQYGKHEDEKAGEQFYHYTVRHFISSFMKGNTKKSIDSLLWATGDIGFINQIKWFKEKVSSGIRNWENYSNKCYDELNKLDFMDKQLFTDFIILQVKIHLTGCIGSMNLCRSLEAFLNNDIIRAFIYASESMKNFDEGYKEMLKAEHGKWKNYYYNDCLTNIKLTVYCLDSLRKYIRMIGESPEFYIWQKKYLFPKSERGVVLLTNNKNQLSDDELIEQLELNNSEFLNNASYK